MSAKLYCYDGAIEAARGGDPHAVILEISRADARKIEDTQLTEHVGRWEIGEWVSVTDLVTGKSYEVASAPCGEGCHCAAVAREPEA